MKISLFNHDLVNIKYGYNKVDNHLYRGSVPTIGQLIELRKQGVNQIFDFRHNSMRGLKFIEVAMCKLLGIKYNRMKFSFLEAKYPKLEDFETVARAIKENGEKGGKTLLHCNSGRHRTAQMVEFYNLTHGETLEDCKRMYPLTYNARARIVLRDLAEKDGYFNRQREDVLPRNPISRFLVKRNNRIVSSTAIGYQRFKNILLK